jgi:CubicO group peptidase (beta-lactamase class C family)
MLYSGKNKKSVMNKFKGAFVLILLVFIFNSSQAQTKIEKLDKLINTYYEYGKFNGSVLVAEKGEIIYKKGFGWANAEAKIANQSDTKFRLGSVTKQFTAMLIVQLVEAGKLKLDVPISTYLPDYPKKNADLITIHHLLTHTSGIPDFTSFPNYHSDLMKTPHKPVELVKLFADSVLQFTPGEKFKYSNSGYILLGYIIESVTGKTYAQVLQDKIFTPLKMINTGVDYNNTIAKNKASGYDRMGTALQPANYIDMSVPFAAGSIYSTVEDMYLWDQALYTEKLLPKKYRDLLFGNYISALQRGSYGYGWFIGKMPIGSTSEQIETIFHDGDINGFTAIITRIPSDKSLIVLLSNTGGAPLPKITFAINGILYDKPYNFPKKSIAYSLFDVIEKDGISNALLHYKTIKDSSSYYLNESEMNGVGYQFLQSGRAKEAVAVFKLNVEEYPNSFNAYDSYGEALLAFGDKPGAIENYLKSVKLNPQSESGLKALKELGIDNK